MAGTPDSGFGDFVLTTGPAIFTGVDQMVNDVQKQTFLIKRFLMGRDTADTVQSGSVIKDQIFLDNVSTYQTVHPNEDVDWVNPQVLTEWSCQWRYGQDHMSWTDQELEKNIPEGLKASAVKVAYKRLKRTKEMRLWTSFVTGMDDELFAVPDRTTMEDQDGKVPYSIFALTNEFINGLPAASNQPGGTWTTVQGIAPATYGNWKPAAKGYKTFAADTADNVFEAFDDIFLQLRFESPGTKAEYFDNPRLYRQFIVCSRTGMKKYQKSLRAQNDQLVVQGRQDPAYHHPQYAGIDLVYASGMDTAAVYPTGASDALSTELDEANVTHGLGSPDTSTGAAIGYGGPRYVWLNGNHMKAIYHARWYMKYVRQIDPERQVNSHIIPAQCWHNYIQCSRRHNGIVFPATDTTAT